MDDNQSAWAQAIYVREDAVAILGPVAIPGPEAALVRVAKSGYLVVDDSGVKIPEFHEWRLSQEALQDEEALHWHPLGELENAPNLLKTPVLPFPFSAAHLAAFMLGGTGLRVRERFGNWSDGPDERALLLLGAFANKAREAVRLAFSAYRAALTKVEPLEPSVQQRATVLYKLLDRGYDEANERESIGPGTTADDYSARHARASKSVEFLLAQAEDAAVEAEGQYRAWRKAMTCTLLAPTLAETSTEASSAGRETSQASMAMRGADARHEKNRAFKTKALEFWKANQGSMSRDAAADYLSKSIPLERDTIRGWLRRK